MNGLGALGLHLLVFARADVRDDLLCRRTQYAVATRVIRAVVTIDEHIDLAGATRLQARQQVRRRIRELGVDDQQAVGAHQPADRAAALVEDADVAAKRREDRRGAFTNSRRFTFMIALLPGPARGAGVPRIMRPHVILVPQRIERAHPRRARHTGSRQAIAPRRHARRAR